MKFKYKYIIINIFYYDKTSIPIQKVKVKVGIRTITRTKSKPSKSKSISTRKSRSIPRFLNRNDIPECVHEDNLAIHVREKQRERKTAKVECDNKRFGFITQYFNEDKASLTHLLYALYSLYHHELKKDTGFIITFREFIDLFPRDTSVSNQNFRKQHVFEAMCKLLLLFNYDNNHWGKKRYSINPLKHIQKGISKKKHRK